MLVLVMYDIETSQGSKDQKRLRSVAKYCERYGIRVQNSVFEINVDCTQYGIFKKEMSGLIDEKRDSLRYYIMGNKFNGKIEKYGRNTSISVCEALVI